MKNLEKQFYLRWGREQKVDRCLNMLEDPDSSFNQADYPLAKP